ncbi:NUC194 domain-containing protein [Zopfochytrium polystomum]|nr:NUC194 domain-containing protein [Zopfochytrium polystomum]
MDVPRLLEGMAQSADAADAILADLQTAFSETWRSQTGLVISAIFDKKTGLLAFLKQRRNDVSPKAKSLAFRLLADVFDKLNASVKTHSADVQTVCWAYFSSKESAAVKRSTVFVTLTLVENKLLQSDEVKALFDRYLATFIQSETKLVSTVKSSVLELLGAVARHYADCVTDSSQLRRKLMSSLQTMISSLQPDMELISGAFMGFGHFMFTFALTPAEREQVFACVRKSIVPVDNMSRYSVATAGMTMIANHIEQFRQELCSDKKTLYYFHSCLKAMCQHKNPELSKLGFKATDAVLRQISRFLLESQINSDGKEIFLNFVSHYIEKLNSEYLVLKDVSQAIRALGIFAGPCKMYMPDEELLKLQDLLVRRVSVTVSDSVTGDMHVHLGSFIDSFSSIGKELMHLDESFLSASEQTAKNMLSEFPKLRPYYKAPVAKSFVSLLWMMHEKETVLEPFWTKIAYHALVLSSISSESESAELGPTDYQEYTVFWKSLFEDSNTLVSEPSAKKNSFRRILYDCIMEVILELPKQLNLNIKEQGAEGSSEEGGSLNKAWSGDTSKLQAENAKDFMILVDYSRFCEWFIANVAPSFFREWIYKFGKQIIAFSTKNPLISAFYKLLAVCLCKCEEARMFADILKRPMDEAELEGLPSEVKDDTDETVQKCYCLFLRFLKEVIFRMEQYKDDLRAACLKLLLSAPIELVDLRRFSVSVVSAFEMGLTFLPLAELALSALETWTHKLPRALLREYFKVILPALEDFLVVDFSPTEDSVDKSAKPLAFSRKASALKKKKSRMATVCLSPCLATTPNLDKDNSSAMQLQELRIRMLKYLGSIGSDNKMLLHSEATEDLIAWDSKKVLTVRIPFQELVMDFQIDDLLPRIIDLAGSSPDRKLKVAACELLHSLMIIMIGNSQAFLAEKDARNPYHKLYIKVFPVLLQLAADLEPVARDLFRPLTIQLVHWLTRNMQSENPETMALLQSCFDAAVSSNGTLRDFGADCLLEYLKWSIKHATDKELAANPFNVKSLFKRLYLLCGHASPLKRLGAAVIFNRIYREFRESPPLVDLFSLEIFYYFMLSLKISGSEKPAEVGAKHETIKALRHLLKIVEMKSDVFLKPTKNRRPVPALRSPDLPSFVAWLFEQAGGLELQYVHESLEIFDALVKKLSGVINWFQSKIKVDFDFPIRVIEYGSGASASARTKYPFGELEGSNKFTVWLKHILVAFDSYLYLIRCKVINTDAILTSKQSHLAEATEYFIESCLNTNLADTGMTSAEQLAFSKLKSDVVLRVLNFSEVAAKSSPQSLPGFMVAHSMYWKVLAGCILSPDSVGFGIDTASDAQSSLKEILISLIQQFKSSSIKLETLYVELQAECESQAVRELTKEHTPSSYDQQLRKVEGLLFLRKLGLFDEVVLPLGFWTNAYLASLCSRALTLSVAVEINRRDLAASLVELALSEKSFLFGALDLLMPKCSSENNGPLKVYSKLKKTINEALIGDANVAIKFLEERLTHPICMEILASLINTNPISLSNDFLSKLLAEQMLMRRLITRSQSSRADFVNFLLVVLHGRAAAFRKNNELWKPLLNAFASSVAGSRSLAEISELLAVLPDFLTDPDPPVIEECLSDLVSSKFPLSPDDLAQGSEKYIEYDGCIKRLFQAMIASSDNFSVEKALLLHLCSGMENTFSSQFEVAVFQKAQKIESAAFAALTEFCKKYIYETGLPAAVRCRIMERVLFPLLNGCTGRLRSHFFAMNIKMIMDIIAAPLPNQEQELLDAILIRSAHFGLMQICYSSLPATALHSKTGEVLQAFISPDKTGEKELTLALIKAASDVKKKAPPVPNETGYKERLLLNEAAYCAMAACLLATQSRAKVEIFTGYLFAEKPVLWENMINTMEPIHLETDLAEDILQIRLENTQKSSTSVPFQRRSAKYLASQYLANSSLSSVVESNGVRAENDAGSDLSSEAQETPQRSGAKGGPVIDEDWFNSKPFMKSVTGVIWQLSQEEQISRDMPSWMKALLQKLEKRDTHINVVLFLTKIILNLPTLFSPFASSFWKPLARLVAAGDKYGSGLNYFIQDVLLLLIQWSGQNPEAFSGADLELVLSMTRWLVRHTANDSRARIRNNIRLIRSLMENLKNYLIAPTDVLTEFLAIEEGTTPAKPLYFTSVYYIQIFIANSIDPFDLRGLSSPDSDELQFYKKLVKLLSHKSLDVYSLSAECLGHVLRFLKSEKRLIFPDLLEWITQKIGELLSKTDPRQVITITNRITVAFPDITSTFYKRLLYFFPRLDSDMKAKVLETLLSGASELEDLYSELIGIDLMALIRYRHEDCQSFVLGILAVISPKLSSNQVDTILNDAFEYCGSHPSERCRSAFLSLVFQLYRRLDTLSHQAKQLLKLALLNGLSDVVDEIRQSVAAFFEAQVLKDTDIFGRFDELLSEWHLSEVENTFIPAAIQFIFNACKQSPIFDKKIFEHGLPEARFNDRNLAINVDWMGVSSMVPLFAGTQMKTQRNQDDLDESEVGLRATLDMIWTPTQDINPSMARQLFSASAQEIDSVRPQRLSQTQSASTAPTVVRRVRRYAATNPRSFADDSERKKRVAEKQLNLQREARSRKVTLYRRYRDGELPDIEITHKNFIEPLQLLAARDTDFGGQILSLLTIKIFHEMEGKVDEAKCQALEDALSSCASRSSMYFPPFVTFILHVLFDLPKIGAKISPKTISRISISSSNVALGSLVLEKIAEKHVEPGSKRQKTQTSGAARSPKALVEIAKMYRAINDGDVYRSIFESMVSLSEVTKAATAAESIGDYDIARDNYIYGLNTEGVAVSDAEPDLWAEGRLHCMNVLGDWSNLFLALRKDVEGNWNTLWEDEKRDIYLPLFVRSITKLPGGYVDEDGILHHWDPTGTPLTKFVAESKALGWKWEYLQRFEIKGLLASAFQEKDFALSQYYTTKAFKNFLYHSQLCHRPIFLRDLTYSESSRCSSSTSKSKLLSANRKQ